MVDLIETFVNNASDPSLHRDLENAIIAYSAELKALANRGDRSLVAAAEQACRDNPAAAFEFDASGSATLHTQNHHWHAGRFETVSIAQLKARARETSTADCRHRARLWVFDGATAATDIGSLQAASGGNTLFQVASQFNCLESPGPFLTSVYDYFGDPTQGPRASISAFPGTLLRHYSAPSVDGDRFVQTEAGPQIELLGEACGRGAAPHGYFTGGTHSDTRSLLQGLDQNFDLIQVGVQSDVQVVLGLNWDGGVEQSDSRRIVQVFTSTAAGGMYGAKHSLGADGFYRACQQLLRAAYLGTLLSAVTLAKPRVVLTLIGGGVFCNPSRLIWDSILWAMDEIQPLLCADVDVIVNGYNLGQQMNLIETVLPDVRKRGGAICQFLARRNVAITR